MDIKPIITTYRDLQNWTAFLGAQPKEKLMDLLLEKMTKDEEFCREIHITLNPTNKHSHKLIEDYVKAIKHELDKCSPTDYAKAAVEEGTMAATVEQLPRMIGSLGVETAVKVIDGETVEETIPVALQLVTKE